jgi:hypothetical protein
MLSLLHCDSLGVSLDCPLQDVWNQYPLHCSFLASFEALFGTRLGRTPRRILAFVVDPAREDSNSIRHLLEKRSRHARRIENPTGKRL